MKLELKHLVGYLPYGLLGIETKKGSIKELLSIDLISGLRVGDMNEDYIVVFFQFKPILRPLSDLTKEIEVDGEKFYPCDYWADNELHGVKYMEELNNMAKYDYFDGYLPYMVVDKLYQWHFDIHNLIPNNLAIDINTINREPSHKI